MKHIKILLAGLLLPCIAMAQKKSEPFTLNVEITKAQANTKVYLVYQTEGKKIIDSAANENGMFVFSGSLERPLNATLVTDYESLGIQQLMKSSTKGGNIDPLKLYLHAGVINLKTERLVQNGVFSGSVINVDNERLKAQLKTIEDERLSISKELRAGNFIVSANDKASKQPRSTADSLKVLRLVKRLDSLGAATRPVYKQFIIDNPNSYIALNCLMTYAGSFPNLAAIQPMFDKLSAQVRNTVEGKQFQQFLLDRKNMVAGTKAPEFTQNDVNGKPISLSMFKGKYVLLDFWASWCGPCRAANPELVQIYHDFKDRNFTTLGISLDEVDGRNLWLKAIKDDGLVWTQVSDLKHWDNSVAKLYSIHAIPQSFLIDPNGIIVAKGLDHKELRKKLEEVLLK